MVSAKGLSLNDKKSKELLLITDSERPCGAQIFGNDPKTMAIAAEKALEFAPQFIDINMGCPAPKVAASGGGALLMKNPVLAEEIVKQIVAATTLPVTVKMRAGWDDNTINAVELAQRCENAGAAAITVHGRTKVQMYSPPVNTDIIKAVKKAVKVPVIGNGDVTDGKSAAKMLEETNCDLVMVGRGALGRPWVFKQINAYLEHERILPEPPVIERMLIMLKHIEKLCEYKGERVGIREARKHAAWYTKGLRGAAEYRAKMSSIESMDDLKYIAGEFIELSKKNGTI
jgi:nifR3 family TIM-barrel protein